MGLRWLEQSEHGGRRGRKPPAQHAPRADSRNSRGHHCLRFCEHLIFLRRRAFERAGDTDDRRGRRARFPGQGGRRVHRHRRDDLHVRHLERLDSFRLPCPLRRCP